MPANPPPPRRLDPAVRRDDPSAQRKSRRMVHRGANLIVPGLGHLMAKRYLAGTIFMALSLAGFALFVTGILSLFAQYVAALKAELDDTTPAAFTTGRLLLEAGLGVIVVLVTYLWAWIDMGRNSQPADDAQSGS